MQCSEIVDVANLCSGDRGCCKLVISEISEIGDVAKYDFVDVASLRFGRSWMLQTTDPLMRANQTQVTNCVGHGA